MASVSEVVSKTSNLSLDKNESFSCQSEELELLKITTPPQGMESLVHPATLRDEEYYQRKSSKAIEKQGGLIVIDDKDECSCAEALEKDGFFVIATQVPTKQIRVKKETDRQDCSPTNIETAIDIFTTPEATKSNEEKEKEENIDTCENAPVTPEATSKLINELNTTAELISPLGVTFEEEYFDPISNENSPVKSREFLPIREYTLSPETSRKSPDFEKVISGEAQIESPRSPSPNSKSCSRNIDNTLGAAIVRVAMAQSADINEQNTKEEVKYTKGDSKLCDKLLNDTTMDPWEYREQTLLHLVKYIFSQLGLVTAFEISEYKLNEFIRKVRDGYSRNHYHNFRKAVCSTQMVYLLLSHGKLMGHLTFLEILALVVGAICLNIDHPGVNNEFVRKSNCVGLYCGGNTLELEDNHILEKHHFERTKTLLEKDSANILERLTDKEQTHFFHLLERCFVSSHSDYDVSATIEKLGPKASYFDRHNFEHRAKLVELIIVCADMSSFLRPFKVAKFWGDLLQEQMFIQGDREKKNGFPTSQFMDRNHPRQGLYISGLLRERAIPALRCFYDISPDAEAFLDAAAEGHGLWRSDKYVSRWRAQQWSYSPDIVHRTSFGYKD
eukprot:Nk52_evm14s442 gene=Nk52_evmTU14s442